MDTVFEYRENFCNYIDTMDDLDTVVITLDQFFYLILSSNPSNNNNLLDITKKILRVVKSNNLSSNIKGLKKLYNCSNMYGLSDEINMDIYNLLLIDQLIIKNNNLLKQEYNSSLDSMNRGLIENYNIKKRNLISKILEQ